MSVSLFPTPLPFTDPLFPARSLVASDLISRGIDMPHVHHVISYDAPVDMAKYVHRVGRTARAGRAGDAWSLVEEQEARYFKLMLTRSGRLEKVRKEKPGKKEVKSMEEAYEVSLRGVGGREDKMLTTRTPTRSTGCIGAPRSPLHASLDVACQVHSTAVHIKLPTRPSLAPCATWQCRRASAC